jgi:hypothetical protein
MNIKIWELERRIGRLVRERERKTGERGGGGGGRRSKANVGSVEVQSLPGPCHPLCLVSLRLTD